jgi:hypothetical protein
MARSKVCKRHVHHVSARQTAQFGLQVPLYFQEAGLPWTSKQTDPLAPACAIRLRRPFSLFLSSLANSVPSANALCLFVLFFFCSASPFGHPYTKLPLPGREPLSSRVHGLTAPPARARVATTRDS